jgi:hypothetical protein
MTAPRILLLAALLLLVVSATADTSKSDLQLSDLPAAVQKTLLQQKQHGTILHLGKILHDGQELYEAQVKSDVSSKTLRIDSAGLLLEVDESIALTKVPPEARKAIESSVGDGKIKKLESIKLASGLIAAYRVQFERNGKESELRISPDGRLVQE